MSGIPLEPYQYEDLPNDTSLRILELLPGEEGDPISCLLHTVDSSNTTDYEAVSYAWGDPNIKAPVNCHGKRLEVTVNLHNALSHFRYKDRSRFLWADALCTNQSNVPEKGCQVSRMRKTYENATAVLSWLGPDANIPQAKVAIESILQLSEFICQKLGISISDLDSIDDVYLEVVFKNRSKLPLPDECGFVTEAGWKSLVWLYSNQYFTRVWVIQEINANKQRLLHCGHEKIDWNRVHLVAGYIMMETAWSKKFGFSSTYCWWVATMSTELISHPKNWLHILYLASNFSCADPRDMIFGLRGLMIITERAELLHPDYSKSVLEVYRNTVEAALASYHKTDVLLYATGGEIPSWVPQWNCAMLFRNPFRFGKAVPWKPAGDTQSVWKINHDQNILSLTGFSAGSIRFVESYNDSFFGNAMFESESGRAQLRHIWHRILKTLADSQSRVPFSSEVLTAAATSLSFGCDENTEPAVKDYLLHNFVAYLKSVLDEETYSKYIPSNLADQAKDADGRLFGKPVWDFDYPESSFFITDGSLIGCSTSTNEPGDIVCVPLGSTYPIILRPVDDHFLVKGFAYVHGIMHGELRDPPNRIFEIR